MQQQPYYNPYQAQPRIHNMGGAPPPYSQQQQPHYAQVPMQPIINITAHAPPTTPRVVVAGPITSHRSIRVICPYCRSDVTTSVDYESGGLTHLWAAVLFFLCCPLMCVPYCCDGTKDTVHKCPACGRHLALVRRL